MPGSGHLTGVKSAACGAGDDLPMLSFEDCVALCGLTEEEVRAIAEHEHIPEIAAAEYANYLITRPDGELYIKAIIRDDIERAAACGERDRELALKLLLRNFVRQHPRCDERRRAELHVPERRSPGSQGAA
jgi:hypothetical protein